MKKFGLAFAFFGAVSPVFAGGLTEPTMDPAVVTQDAGSSGSDNWVGLLMTILVFGAAIAK